MRLKRTWPANQTKCSKSISLLLAGLALVGTARAEEDSIKSIARIKPSVVAIATLHKTRAPAVNFVGTGFAAGDGLSIVTNAHVVASVGVTDPDEVLGIVAGSGAATDFRRAEVVRIDSERDLAELRITGTPLPAARIADSDAVQEGQFLLFTGFPLGLVLGFHHVSHRAMVSAITPITTPVLNSQKLNARLIKQLRRPTYYVFQLDGTAYPGNSGSPLYNPHTGEVLGIINKVFVQGGKETAISQPSGITYAIPSKFIAELLEQSKE